MTSRKVRLYNRHGLYLEVRHTGEITGATTGDSVYADITIRTVDFGKVSLQGTKTSFYLYVKSNGDLGTTSLSSNECIECVWQEEFANRPGFLQYRSSVYPKWFLGITKYGKKKRGSRTKPGQRATEWVAEPIS